MLFSIVRLNDNVSVCGGSCTLKLGNALAELDWPKASIGAYQFEISVASTRGPLIDRVHTATVIWSSFMV